MGETAAKLRGVFDRMRTKRGGVAVNGNLS